jgi:hypothetical protein
MLSCFLLTACENLFLICCLCVQYLLLHILLFQKRTVMWLRMRGLCSLASQASRQSRLVFCHPEFSLASFFTSSCSSSTRDESTPAKSYGEQRLDSLAGHELYPHKFRVTARVEDILQTYSYLSPGQEAVRERVVAKNILIEDKSGRQAEYLVANSVADTNPVRTYVFGLLDPDLDLLVRGMDPDPTITKQK